MTSQCERYVLEVGDRKMNSAAVRLNPSAWRSGPAAACASVAILAAAATAHGQCQVGHLSATDGAPWDLFGYSVAISGDTAIVSAVLDDTAIGTDAGSAFIFVRNGGLWTQQAQLFPNPPGAFDQFGYSVAIDGNTAVVGANTDDTPAGLNAGSAWVFVRNGGVWTQQAGLLAPNAMPNDILGVSVAIAGDTIIVGAPGVDTLGASAGSAYVFHRSNGAWTYSQQLFASDGAAGDSFGWSVTMDGDTAVIGASDDDTRGGTNAGSAYVFVSENGVWTEQAHLVASDGAAHDSFGYGVAISGDTIIVGATGIYPPDGLTNAGSVYVFLRDADDVWTERQKLVSPNPSGTEHFGWSVALDGQTALVGAPGDPQLGGGSEIGSVYTFIRSGDVWTLDSQLAPADGAAGDIFGVSVAIEGDTAVVSADFDDTPAEMDTGSAYIFDLDCRPACPTDFDGNGSVDGADLGILLSQWGGTGSADLDGNGTVNGADLGILLAAWGPC